MVQPPEHAVSSSAARKDVISRGENAEEWSWRLKADKKKGIRCHLGLTLFL